MDVQQVDLVGLSFSSKYPLNNSIIWVTSGRNNGECKEPNIIRLWETCSYSAFKCVLDYKLGDSLESPTIKKGWCE